MKAQAILLASCVIAPSVVLAQDVRVRLYTTRPPEALSLRATDGAMHWRLCLTCADNSGPQLAISANSSSNGEEYYVTGRYQIRPESGPTFKGNYPARIEKRDGHLLVTVTLPLEEYVASVLMAESGDFQNAESRKAMAVVARTYAMRFMGQHAKDGFDFCDTTHCQVFGWRGISSAIRTAVNATQGEVLRYEGKLAETFYHQNCGGKTAAAQEAWPSVHEPYLKSQADPYCVARGVLLWESTIRVQELDRAMRAEGLKTPEGWRAIEISTRSESGRAQRLRLAGGVGGNVLVSASSFRFAVDRELGWQKIRSDLFDVRNAGGEIVFSGKGAGHGVGLCQAGAEEMARQGKSYREILSFYYPGTQIGSLQGLQWKKLGSERIELLSTQPETDSSILPVAERVLKDDEAAIGWQAGGAVQLKIYPTIDSYRDSTGEPGWVAASTRRHTIRLQPLFELKRRSVLESTLRHEMMHVLVEERAKAGTPLWFREGVVLCLTDEVSTAAAPVTMTDGQMEAVLEHPTNREAVKQAYAAAENRVETLLKERGKETVLGWLRDGIPR
ncbi:MAG TPA: SpoIID/LytB domain-containing protein [Candidatus Acidoferrum sp.]|nr:SpoIID/LytB domain-containing protein [Candidatus Acidoferrum sp.]